MSTLNSQTQAFEADLVARDWAGRTVLIVEAKGYPVEHPAETLSYLTGLAQVDGYWLLADPIALRFYKFDATSPAEGPLAVLDTAAILREYDPAMEHRRLTEDYLVALIDAWIRDLALRWRSAAPPGLTALAATGLLERLAGGSTQREATVYGDRLR